MVKWNIFQNNEHLEIILNGGDDSFEVRMGKKAAEYSYNLAYFILSTFSTFQQ